MHLYPDNYNSCSSIKNQEKEEYNKNNLDNYSKRKGSHKIFINSKEENKKLNIELKKLKDKEVEKKNKSNEKIINNAIIITSNTNNLKINNNPTEESKNDENEKITSEEEQRRIILIKGEVFKNLKRLKTNTELKIKENKNRQKDIYKEKDSSESKTKNSYGIESDYTDTKDDKALRKKYLKIFFGNINHYSKKIKNNIKRATSKDSETSDDRQDTVKRNNRNNNITTSSNIIQKKNRPINIRKRKKRKRKN